MLSFRGLLSASALLALLTTVPLRADPVTVTSPDASGVIRVMVGHQLFTEYHAEGASRPYLYPILAPDGTPLTRSFPQVNSTDEDHDHPWHRSLWFAHSMVNGVDFWNEGKGDVARSPSDKGTVVTDRFVNVASGDPGVIVVTDRWVGPGDKLICTDERTIAFGADERTRYIDFGITIHALAGTPLVFGDNKDGTMAMRLAQWMTMPHKNAKVPSTGHILDANGDRDGAVWGKRANWCDYYAQHDGKTYGVAIFDDPHNLRHPVWWMARDYGLFGANPFGQHDYEHLANAHAGDYTVPAGGLLTLHYRFLIHTGTPKSANIAQKYEQFAGGGS